MVFNTVYIYSIPMVSNKYLIYSFFYLTINQIIKEIIDYIYMLSNFNY